MFYYIHHYVKNYLNLTLKRLQAEARRTEARLLAGGVNPSAPPASALSRPRRSSAGRADAPPSYGDIFPESN
jgi:hypothetical protein